MGVAAPSVTRSRASLNFFVVGAESDRQTERGGFERVVDAYAESAADITPFGIAVGRGENTYRIENEQLFAIERCFGGALRIADSSSEGFSEQAVDAAFVHFVRCHDEFDRGVIVYQADQKVFVRSPGRAGDQQTGAAFEPFDEVDFFFAAAAISATRSKRVSPATTTLSKPSSASNFLESLF